MTTQTLAVKGWYATKLEVVVGVVVVALASTLPTGLALTRAAAANAARMLKNFMASKNARRTAVGLRGRS